MSFKQACRRLGGRLGGLGIVTALIVAGLWLCVLPACQKPQQPAHMVQPDQAVMHAVYAEDLRAAMAEMNRDAAQQLRMQLYTSQGPVVDMGKVAQLAEKMAVVADRLPSTVEGVQMAPSERAVFVDLSQRLERQAIVLKQQAEQNQLIEAQGTMNEVINTCNVCHTMFRSVAGPID